MRGRFVRNIVVGAIFALACHVLSLNLSSGMILQSIGAAERDVRLIISQGAVSAQGFGGYRKSVLPANYAIDMPMLFRWNVQPLRANLVSFPNENGDTSGFFTYYKDVARSKAADTKWDAGLGRTDHYILWPYMPYVFMPTWFAAFCLYLALVFAVRRLGRLLFTVFKDRNHRRQHQRGFDPLHPSIEKRSRTIGSQRNGMGFIPLGL